MNIIRLAIGQDMATDYHLFFLSIFSVTRLFLSQRNPWLCVAELLLPCPCRSTFGSLMTKRI